MNTLISCRIKNSQIEKNNRKIKENSRSVFGAYEWAKLSANFIDGCKNDCKYCYSKEMAIRFNRKTARNWKKEEIRKHSLSKKFKKIKGTVMFPSSHDIHPEHLKESIIFLDNILSAGNKVLIVSKPSLKCIREICKNFNKFKGNILFRFTIGSSNSNILRFWEPYAPDFKERLASLKWAHAAWKKSPIRPRRFLLNARSMRRDRPSP